MNCSSDKIRAAVTPMVCILSAAVILLNFCMLDAVQIRAIESLTERRNAFCAGSLLSFFYDTLERDYGLYGIYGEKESEIRNRYAEMLRGGAESAAGRSSTPATRRWREKSPARSTGRGDST